MYLVETLLADEATEPVVEALPRRPTNVYVVAELALLCARDATNSPLLVPHDDVDVFARVVLHLDLVEVWIPPKGVLGHLPVDLVDLSFQCGRCVSGSKVVAGIPSPVGTFRTDHGVASVTLREPRIDMSLVGARGPARGTGLQKGGAIGTGVALHCSRFVFPIGFRFQNGLPRS